jgi:hypothetical protein
MKQQIIIHEHHEHRDTVNRKKRRTEERDRKEEINESVNTTKCMKFI